MDKHAKVYVVVDAAYFNKEFIDNCRSKRYHVCGRIKNNAVVLQDDGSEINIIQYFEKIISEKERKITITVRGKEKTYYAVEDILNLSANVKLLLLEQKSICLPGKIFLEKIVSVLENILRNAGKLIGRKIQKLKN